MRQGYLPHRLRRNVATAIWRLLGLTLLNQFPHLFDSHRALHLVRQAEVSSAASAEAVVVAPCTDGQASFHRSPMFLLEHDWICRAPAADAVDFLDIRRAGNGEALSGRYATRCMATLCLASPFGWSCPSDDVDSRRLKKFRLSHGLLDAF